MKGHNIEVGQETAYEAFLGEVAATDSQPAAEISDTNKCAGIMGITHCCASSASSVNHVHSARSYSAGSLTNKPLGWPWNSRPEQEVCLR